MPIGKKITPDHPSGQGASDHKNPAPEKPQASHFDLPEPKYELSDVIANTQTLNEIQSLISLKKDFEKVFGEMGFSKTHRYSKKFIVNFYGPPGTGKTITAHAIARTFGKKLLLIDYSEIESKYVGETPKNIKKVFDFARKENCIIFFDEADAILSRRVTNMQNATDTSVNQTRSVLLNILNDFEGDLIFATNFISNYDPAFMRRISKHVFFDLPDQSSRRMLLEKYLPLPSRGLLNLEAIAAEITEGLSAADIEKMALLAAFQACAAGRLELTADDMANQAQLIMKSKKENEGAAPITTTRIVSENYVKDQMKNQEGVISA